MLMRTSFSFNYLSDIKSLPGFVKGGKDKVPKDLSDYNSELVARWSDKIIKDHIEEVATKSKNNLEISARDFKTPSYHTGTGSFDCPFFKYDFSVEQAEEDFSKCIFTGVLEVESLDMFNQVRDVIDSCFNFTFDKVICRLPKGERDLKELIYSLDDNKKALSTIFDFSYENDFSSFNLVHKTSGRQITVNDKELEINFSASHTIPEMLEALKEVNNNIFLATSKQYHLLTDADGSEPKNQVFWTTT